MYNQTAVLPISKERAAYLQKQKRKKYMIRTIQISVVIILLAMWEILANIGNADRIFAGHGAGSWSGGAVVVVENAFSHL